MCVISHTNVQAKLAEKNANKPRFFGAILDFATETSLISHDGHPRAWPSATDQQGRLWAQDFPLVVEAALKLRQEQFVIDSELLVLDKDGVSDFSALLSGRHNEGARSTLSTCLLVTARITVA
jgi:hypothetical protein